jgi:hypothetical protein
MARIYRVCGALGLRPLFPECSIKMINRSPTPEEIAREAREALDRRPRRTSHERFTELVRKGWINARGQVTKLLGGTADPEPNYETWTGNGDRSSPRKAKT